MSEMLHVRANWKPDEALFEVKVHYFLWMLTPDEFLAAIEDAESQLEHNHSMLADFRLNFTKESQGCMGVDFTSTSQLAVRNKFRSLVEYFRTVYNCWKNPTLDDGQHRITK